MTERLPEIEGESSEPVVLLTYVKECERWMPLTGWMTAEGWKVLSLPDDKLNDCEPLYWMPLPEHPKEDANG